MPRRLRLPALVAIAAAVLAPLAGRLLPSFPAAPVIAASAGTGIPVVPGAIFLPAALPAATSGPVTVFAAGDIAACDSSGDERTAAILADDPAATILALGDQAYPDGTAADYANCYGPSWGQFKDRTRPVPGNHDYHTANAAAYFAYFGANAGPASNAASRGYYSFDLGAWHVVALNSEQDIAPGGAQLAWLKADLAASTKACTLAIWHRPRFTASVQYADFADVQPFWDALHAAGAEVVLSGHDHDYQRYQPMDASGSPSPDGMREFVVGTGGKSAHELRPDPRRDAEHTAPGFAGVLQLTLLDSGYDWQFISADGSYTDSGSGMCH